MNDLNYYIVTIVSPAGTRDNLGIFAPNEFIARAKASDMIFGSYPNWSIRTIRLA